MLAKHTTQNHAHVSVTELLLLLIFFRWGIRRSIWDEGTVEFAVGGPTNYITSGQSLFFNRIEPSHLSLEYLLDPADWETCETLHSPWTRFRSIFWRKEATRVSNLCTSHSHLYKDSHSVLCSCSCSAESSVVWSWESSGEDDSLSCLPMVAMMMMVIKTVIVTMVTRTT